MSVASHADFSAQRERAAGRLALLRQERGRAVADGGRFDDGKIAQAEAELSRIEDAEAEITRRELADTDAMLKERRAALHAQLAETEVRRLDAIRRAEIAMRMLVTALRDFLREAGG